MVTRNTVRRLGFDHDEMTQHALGQTVNGLELGKYSPSLEVAFRIAAVSDLPIDEVFQHEGPARSKRADSRAAALRESLTLHQGSTPSLLPTRLALGFISLTLTHARATRARRPCETPPNTHDPRRRLR